MGFPNESSIQNQDRVIVNESIQIGILNQELTQNPYFLLNLDERVRSIAVLAKAHAILGAVRSTVRIRLASHNFMSVASV